MRLLQIPTALALALAIATPALADDDGTDCGNTPRDQWMSKDAAKSKAAEMGYEVRRVKEEGGCYEIYGIDKNGAKVEVFMHPVSGVIVKTTGES